MAILSKISPEQAEMIRAIDKLLKVSDLDTVQRAYGHAIQPELLNQWAKGLGLKRSPGQVCFKRLLGKSCSFDIHRCVPPCTDHPSLWLKNGKPYCLISQPYNLSMSDIETIGKFCHQHGLEFEISSWPGWHFPHAVLFVTFKAKK